MYSMFAHIVYRVIVRVSVCMSISVRTLTPHPHLPMINEIANAANVVADTFHAQCPCWPANNLICLRFINDSPVSAELMHPPISPPVTIPPCVCVCVRVGRLSEDSTLTTLDTLKARIRDLEKQLSKGDRFKCLICMVSTKAYETDRADTQNRDNSAVMQKLLRGPLFWGNKLILLVMLFLLIQICIFLPFKNI